MLPVHNTQRLKSLIWLRAGSEVGDENSSRVLLPLNQNNTSGWRSFRLLVNAMTERLYEQQSFEAAVAVLLRDVVALHGAEFGNVQLPISDELVIVAQFGFTASFVTTFERVRCEDGSACGRAFNERKTIVVPDVDRDPAFEPFRPAAKAAGFRSVQTTPLFTPGGDLIGMVSTHFAHVHQPTKIEMDTLKVYSVRAADYLKSLLKGVSLTSRAAEMHARLCANFGIELSNEILKPLIPAAPELPDIEM